MKQALRYTLTRLVYTLRLLHYGWRALNGQLKPGYIIQYVTDRCHLKCAGCFVDLTGENRISLAVQKRIILRSNRVPVVVLTGGEPFSHPALERLCRLWAVYGRVLQIHIPTSGFYPERIARMIRRWQKSYTGGLVSSRLHITLSLDGPAGLHNAIRGNGESFRRLRRSIRLLDRHAGRGVDYSISVTLGHENLGRTADIRHTLDKLDLKKTETINYILTRSKPASFAGGSEANGPISIYNGAAELARLYDRAELTKLEAFYSRLVVENRPGFGLLFRPWLFLKRYKNRAIYRQILRQCRSALAIHQRTSHEKQTRAEVSQTVKGWRPCPAGDRLWVITATGALMPCEMMPFSAGNLLHHDHDTLREADRFNRTVREERCECSHECYLGVSALI